MKEVKRKIEVTQEEYEDIYEALGKYARNATALGYSNVSARFRSLACRIDEQIGDQGGFEE